MVRHGLLSPNSKLLPASTSIDSLASFASDTSSRPESTYSMVSNGELVSLNSFFFGAGDFVKGFKSKSSLFCGTMLEIRWHKVPGGFGSLNERHSRCTFLEILGPTSKSFVMGSLPLIHPFVSLLSLGSVCFF